PFPVEKINKKGTHYWVFQGERYADFAVFAVKVINAGEKFYCPGMEIIGAHVENLRHIQVVLLAAMLHAQGCDNGWENKWLKYPTELPEIDPEDARGNTTNYSYLWHFGLVLSENSNHKRKGKKWQGTEFGRSFIFDGARCSAFVINDHHHVIRKSDEVMCLTDFYTDGVIERLRHEPEFWLAPDWKQTEINGRRPIGKKDSKKSGRRVESRDLEAERIRQEEARIVAELENEKARLDAEQALIDTPAEIREAVKARLDTQSDFSIATELSLMFPVVKAVRLLADGEIKTEQAAA